MTGSGNNDPCFVGSVAVLNLALIFALIGALGIWLASRSIRCWMVVRANKAYMSHYKYDRCANDLISLGADAGLDYFTVWGPGLYYAARVWKTNGGENKSAEREIADAGAEPGGAQPLEAVRRNNIAIQGDRDLPFTIVDLNHPIPT